MTSKIPSCANCKHNEGLRCKAFPDGIPWPIMAGDVSHLAPLPDDNGIQYEPKEEKPKKAQP